MPADSDNLLQAMANLATAIAEATANPKPNYSVGGRSFSWGSYIKDLTDQYLALRLAYIASLGPWQRDIVVTS